MRKQRGFALSVALGLAFAATAACDDRGTPAGIGNPGNENAQITVLPTDVQITVSSTTQLTTNAGTSSALQWLSSNNNVATVSQTGEVTGRSVGTATVTVRFAADTTNAAASTISVIQ
jgi:uncharacterized protein YjdB